MQREEMRALGAAGGAFVANVGGVAAGIHRAAAGRIFGTLGVVGMPVRVVHDGVSGAAYASVAAALSGGPRILGTAISRALPDDGARLADSPIGSLALGALNGFYGDAIAREHRELALELSVRRQGRAIATDAVGLARAYPDATGRIAVFVHGLCETEQAWQVLPFGRRSGERHSYGSRLRSELGYTPVYVRYNTGLHISDNGHRLAATLDDLVRGWPQQVEEVVLVGHSMGGLVARSACHYAAADDARWTDLLRHVFCLGTPHLGAPLEKAANAAGWTLSRLPETRPFAKLVNARSAGIKDLRFGSCVEDDWCDCDPDEFLNDRCKEVPFLPTASYYFVGATLARDHRAPYARILGDLLVQYPSASGDGRRRRIPFEIENGRHVGRANHFQLLNHPAVYDQIVAWLVREPRELRVAT